MPAIELRQISHRYSRRVPTLRDASASFADRSLNAVMGPSGCGKTTLLRLIAGLEKPSEGTILFDNEPVLARAPDARDVAFAFQDAALYPHMTVQQNLAFVPRIRKTSHAEIDRRTGDATDLLRISHLLDRKPHELSAGERQRAALAKCFVTQPGIMLLDEPLANLDAHLRAHLQHDIRLVHEQLGCTTICVTHAWREACALADTVIVMSPGRIEQTGPPDAILRNPATWHVAHVVGDPSANLLRVDLADSQHPALSSLGDKARVVLCFAPAAVKVGTSNGHAIPLTGRILVSHRDELLVETPLGRIATRSNEAAAGHRAGDPISLHVNLSDVSIFADDDTGSRVWPIDAD